MDDATKDAIVVPVPPVKGKAGRPKHIKPTPNPPGNPAWKKGVSGNPGGNVPTEKKPIRKILLDIIERPLDEPFVPRTYGEKVAWQYFQNIESSDTVVQKQDSLEALTERIDGKILNEKEAAPAQVKSSSSLVIVATRKK